MERVHSCSHDDSCGTSGLLLRPEPRPSAIFSPIFAEPTEPARLPAEETRELPALRRPSAIFSPIFAEIFAELHTDWPTDAVDSGVPRGGEGRPLGDATGTRSEAVPRSWAASGVKPCVAR